MFWKKKRLNLNLIEWFLRNLTEDSSPHSTIINLEYIGGGGDITRLLSLLVHIEIRVYNNS